MFRPIGLLSDADLYLHGMITAGREPDLDIQPTGQPYLYRWHVIRRSESGNIYYHVQVASDPERPLHDHPWDNTSVILSGGYDEIFDPHPIVGHPPIVRSLRKGDVQFRHAEEAHRLVLPPDIKYTMTFFTTGPKVREWGFWCSNGWRNQRDVTEILPDGRSIFKGE